MSKALVLGAAALVLSAASASAQVYTTPGYGYAVTRWRSRRCVPIGRCRQISDRFCRVIGVATGTGGTATVTGGGAKHARMAGRRRRA
jgi:hypothetical protein